MDQFEKDIKLELLLKSLTLEKPGPDFSKRVMQRIFEEQSSLEQVQKYPVLRRSFWVFLSLFALLFAVVIVFSVIFKTYPFQSTILHIGMNEILTGYQPFLKQIGTLPLSMASILTATSLLVLLGNLLEKRL